VASKVAAEVTDGRTNVLQTLAFLSLTVTIYENCIAVFFSEDTRVPPDCYEFSGRVLDFSPMWLIY